jgi:hypothetical protein
MTPQTKIRFTETDVSAIPFSAKRVRWHDNQMPGLVLDVTSKAKVFRVYKKLSGRRACNIAGLSRQYGFIVPI